MKIFIIAIVIINTLIFGYLGYSFYEINKNIKDIRYSIDDIKKDLKNVDKSLGGIDKELWDINYTLENSKINQ